MSKFRRNPSTGEWVIFIEDRRKDDKRASKAISCPYCITIEDPNTTEIARFDENWQQTSKKEWQIRVIADPAPILRVEENIEKKGKGIYDSMSGIGAHEIIIETRLHKKLVTVLETENIANIFKTYRFRLKDLKKDKRLKQIIFYKIQSQEEGFAPWQYHSHSQLLALPIIPTDFEVENERLNKYYEYHSRCMYCDIIAQEIKDDERIILMNEYFVAFVPYASQFPFETWILPRTHSSDFNGSDEEFKYLAYIYKEVLQRINKALFKPSYNVLLHTAPFRVNCENYFHWNIKIKPEVRKAAGMEWGTGMFVNTVAPEKAAGILKEIDIE